MTLPKKGFTTVIKIWLKWLQQTGELETANKSIFQSDFFFYIKKHLLIQA